MIKAKHHIIIYPLFKWLIRFLIKRNFNTVNFIGEFKNANRAVLVISNHMSWWDGFWILNFNLKVLQRKFHVMMLENQLRKHWYFQHIGAFSIKKKSRSIFESINYSIALLEQKENMVCMFPQGKIHSAYSSNFVFEKGTERILSAINPETHVVLVANMIDYFSNAKPNLYMYYKTYTAKEIMDLNIEKEYNRFYEQAVTIQKSKVS